MLKIVPLILLFVSCTAQWCEDENYSRLNACYSAWGYDNTLVPHPDSTLWNMETLITFCRSPGRSSEMGCIRREFSSCQYSEWADENQALLEMADLTDNAVNNICDRIRLVERKRDCINGVGREMTSCVSVSENNAQSIIMETVMNGDDVTWNFVKNLKKRKYLSRAECAYNLLRRSCGQEVASLLSEYYYAEYLPYN